MAAVHRGRYSADIEGDFVVFLIGMRLNRPWKVHRWWPVYVAMPRMLRELSRDRERGLLGAHLGLFYGGPADRRPRHRRPAGPGVPLRRCSAWGHAGAWPPAFV
jgi:fumigallin biosynthesis monooxygenase-like protein